MSQRSRPRGVGRAGASCRRLVTGVAAGPIAAMRLRPGSVGTGRGAERERHDEQRDESANCPGHANLREGVRRRVAGCSAAKLVRAKGVV